jgi:hypothetical protein
VDEIIDCPDRRVMDIPRVNSVVVFEVEESAASNYPWVPGANLLFLGEIANMPGHCIVVDRKGKVWWGYHTENFRELTMEEM